jgi:hypothetical protein
VAIVAGIGSWSITAALLACAAFLLAGDLAFSAHRASRGWRPHPERAPNLAGALRGGGVRVLMVVFALVGLSVGAVEVAVPAALEGMGHRELTGVLLGIWGVGSMVCANGMLDHLAPTGTLAEALTWTTAGMVVGVAVGSAVAGALVEAASPGAAMALLGGAGLLAAVVVRATSTAPLRAVAPAAAT